MQCRPNNGITTHGDRRKCLSGDRCAESAVRWTGHTPVGGDIHVAVLSLKQYAVPGLGRWLRCGRLVDLGRVEWMAGDKTLHSRRHYEVPYIREWNFMFSAQNCGRVGRPPGATGGLPFLNSPPRLTHINRELREQLIVSHA